MFLSSKNIFIVLCLITCIYTYFFRLSNDKWQGTIEAGGDSKGYYAYLPEIFIYQDLQGNFFFDENGNKKTPGYVDNFLYQQEGGRVNKYFIGVSILQAPFFLIALALSYLSGLEISGYSILFQYFVSISAIFYFILGLYFLRKTLLKRGFNNITASTTIILIGFATNLFYYATTEPGMSHVYSFFCVCLLLYSFQLFNSTKNIRYLLLTTACVGILTLIRPTNIIFAIAPLALFSSSKELFSFFKLYFSKFKYVLITLALFIIIVSIQPLLYFLQCGHFFVWSYAGEYFDFKNPQFLDVLFSYRKGLFVYTPCLLLSFIGGYYLLKKNTFQFSALLLMLLFSTYIISSWWNWWYGGSFGMRALIEYYPLIALFIVEFVNVFLGKKIIKHVLAVTIIFLVFLNHFQIYQYKEGILLSDGMDKKFYWSIFLSSKKPSSIDYNRIAATFYPKAILLNSNNMFIKWSEDSCLYACGKELADSSTFTIFWYDKNHISLLASNNKFVTCDEGKGYKLIANRDYIGDWEKFEIAKNVDGTISLKFNHNNKWICSDAAQLNSPLLANRDYIGSWERFRLIILKQSPLQPKS